MHFSRSLSISLYYLRHNAPFAIDYKHFNLYDTLWLKLFEPRVTSTQACPRYIFPTIRSYSLLFLPMLFTYSLGDMEVALLK